MNDRTSRRDVQGLRALAVTMVVVFHAQLPLSGGFTGVDVFFVISGYFMTRILLRELDQSGRISFRDFYARRIRRLLPALAVVTVVTVVVGVLVQAPLGDQQETSLSGLATIFFGGNIAAAYYTGFGYFSTSSVTDPFLHMWSLGVEEQYYFLFPITLLVIFRAARRTQAPMRALAVSIVMLSLVSFLGSYLISEQVGPGRAVPSGLAFYMFPPRVWEFGIGALVAVLPTVAAGTGRRVVREALAIVGIALIVVGAVVITGRTPFPGTAALLPAVGCGLLLEAGRHGTTAIGRMLSSRVLSSVGDASYSWYLWHWPAVVFARYFTTSTPWIAAAAFGSIGLAYASYYLVENPVRFGSSARSFARSVRLGVRVVVPTALVCALAAAFAYAGWGSATLRDLRRSDVAGAGETRGCTGQGTVTRDLYTKCTWSVPSSRGEVQVVGDSHAGALIEGVVAAARPLHYSVVSGAGASCSFTPESVHETEQVSNCGQLFRWNLERATTRSDKPKVLVVSHDSSARVADSGGIDRWIAALRASLGTVVRAGVPVVLVEDVPEVQGIPTPCRFGVVAALDCSSSRASDRRLKGDIRDAETRLAASFHGRVQVVDPTTVLCTAARCSARSGNALLYTDNQHLSVAGSLLFAMPIRAAIRRARSAFGSTSG